MLKGNAVQVLVLKAGYIANGKGAGLHAAASYRAAEKLYEPASNNAPSLAGKMAYDSGAVMSDGAAGKVHDYTRKEHVITTFINAPADAPPEVTRDLQSVCDAVVAIETRKNARLMRKYEITLARGLSDEEQAAVVKRFCDEHFTQHGLISVASLHNSRASDGNENPHAHILACTRTISADGWHKDKLNIRWMNSKATLARWRDTMGEYSNEALRAAGVDRPVTYNSYASMGIEQEVTKPLGPKAHRLEQQGITTKRGDENRRIMAERALREELQRLEQAESDDAGRRAWFDSFSYQFGGSMDAARDAVHRFRTKDEERGHGLSDDRADANKRLENTFKERQANEPPDQQGGDTQPRPSPAQEGAAERPWAEKIDPERYRREQAAQQQAQPPEHAPTPPSSDRTSTPGIGDQLREAGAKLDDSRYNTPAPDAREPAQEGRARGVDAPHQPSYTRAANGVSLAAVSQQRQEQAAGQPLPKPLDIHDAVEGRKQERDTARVPGQNKGC